MTTVELEAQKKMLFAKADLLIKAAERESRAWTEADETAQQKILADVERLDQRIARARGEEEMRAQIDALTGTTRASIGGANGHRASFGAQVMAGLGKWLTETKATRPQHWTSAPVEVPYDALFAAVLTSDPASGGDLVVPDVQPGIYPVPTAPLTVADLFAQGMTDSNLVTHLAQTNFVNSADTVAEGALKPEATLTFDQISDPVRKIAVWLGITEEMLEDVPQIRSFIDTQLRLMIQLAEEGQLLNGSTTPPDIVGVRNRAGLAPAIPKGTDTVPDAIAKQIGAIYNATKRRPDAVVMNPADWLGAQLLKDSTGAYLGTGPFVAPASETLWGLPTAITSVMPVGIALVGCFKTAAQIFRKGGIRVDATNSHQDWFTKNQVAIRAEERLALKVYQPAAFGEVTGLAG